MSTPLTRRTVLLALAAAALPVRAQTRTDLPVGARRFTIEWLAFRPPGPLPKSGQSLALPEASTIPGRVELLPEKNLEFNNLKHILTNHNYSILCHCSWHAITPQNGRTTARLSDLLTGENPLTGSIAVQRGQHLFLNVDTDYRAPNGLVYAIREHRRLKFGEYHYFDHPAFGGLAQVRVAGDDDGTE